MSFINEYAAFTAPNLDVESADIKIVPKLGDYQLLGDSLLVRFSENVLRQSSRYVKGMRGIGLCVSGQRIDQLRHKIKHNFFPLSTKVMILIGTNDILCGHDVTIMIQHFKKLLKLIRNKKVADILILTLPPIPKLCMTFDHWTTIRRYNLFLKKLSEKYFEIKVADICPLFTSCEKVFTYDINYDKLFKQLGSLSQGIRRKRVSCSESLSDAFKRRKIDENEYKINENKNSRPLSFSSTVLSESTMDISSNNNEMDQKDDVLLNYKITIPNAKIKSGVDSETKIRNRMRKNLLMKKGQSIDKKVIPSPSKDQSATCKEPSPKHSKAMKYSTSRIFTSAMRDILGNNYFPKETTPENKEKAVVTAERVFATTKWKIEDIPCEESWDTDEEAIENDTPKRKVKIISQNSYKHNIYDNNVDSKSDIQVIEDSKRCNQEESAEDRFHNLDNVSESDESNLENQGYKRQINPFSDWDFEIFLRTMPEFKKYETDYRSQERDKSVESLHIQGTDRRSGSFSDRGNSSTTCRFDESNESRKSLYDDSPLNENRQMCSSKYPFFNLGNRLSLNFSPQQASYFASTPPPPLPPPLPATPPGFVGMSKEKQQEPPIELSAIEKDMMMISNYLIHLEFYEKYYMFGKPRLDMIHLNAKGLWELKKFLTDNGFVR